MTDADATQALGPDDAPRVLAGRYRLDGVLGRGGMAVVHRGTDLSLGRPVAVKVMTSGAVGDESRFDVEVRTLARLSHPGLVNLFDAGTDGDHRYFVMEIVEGETLGDRMRYGPLEPHEVARVGADLTAALAYVHEQGVVHRDLKPGNVLLGRDGRVRLADFGIAKLVDATNVTATGLTVGTAAYLAPEQVAGEPVGPPADVYALGLVLLECLTGRREYDGPAVEAAVARLTREPFVPDDLPPGWPELLVAMTARRPVDRPRVAEVHRRLTALVAGRPLLGVPTAGGGYGDATRVMTTGTRPAPTATAVTTGAPVVTERPLAAPPRRSNGPLVALVLALLLGLVVVGGVVASQRDDLPETGRVELPQQIERDLQELEDEVDR